MLQKLQSAFTALRLAVESEKATKDVLTQMETLLARDQSNFIVDRATLTSWSWAIKDERASSDAVIQTADGVRAVDVEMQKYLMRYRASQVMPQRLMEEQSDNHRDDARNEAGTQ